MERFIATLSNNMESSDPIDHAWLTVNFKEGWDYFYKGGTGEL